MGLFKDRFSNIVEWEEYSDDVILWKWHDNEIKKGSRLVIRTGQNAIFMQDQKIEGIFEDEGTYDIESQIVPFLSSLKGYKFGLNSSIRAEIIFINTKVLTVKWGTKMPVNVPVNGIAGGVPIRAFGTFNCRISDYITLIDKIAGIKQQYTVEDLRERVLSVLDELLMKWIGKAGRDMYDLQSSAGEIAKGIGEELDMQIMKDGITITDFRISSFSYPEEIRKVQEKAAAEQLVNGSGPAGTVSLSGGKAPKFCPQCGTPVNNMKFCPECGNKLV